jgi:hypothetical protein
MRLLSNGLPLTYMLRLLRDPWLGLPWGWTDTLAVLGFTVAGLIGWRAMFRWE